MTSELYWEDVGMMALVDGEGYPVAITRSLEGYPFALWLKDEGNRELHWGDFASLDEARKEWREIAGRSAQLNLQEFFVVDAGTGEVYVGNYVTDEC